MSHDFHALAIAFSQRLLFSAVGGTLLAAAVWFLLRLVPKKDASTNFAVWFSTLLATAALPFLSFHRDSNAAAGSHAMFTVSTSLAWYLFVAWAVIAMAGLARVILATFQVRRLRASAVTVSVESLPTEIQALIEDAQKSRPVSLLASHRLEVPTAIGFCSPAVIFPAWMLATTPAEELKYILLHELAHLRRRDDWTNLAQTVLKAVFFFLPSVWWIERKLSLDREMACDDSVLAHSVTPRTYAECLAHVAERSFLRRQLALVQAAVGRVRQLTERVTMILDPSRPRATQLWKPAIPVVMVLAGLCALPASFTPELVGFASDAPTVQSQSVPANLPAKAQTEQPQVAKTTSYAPEVRIVPASLRTSESEIAPRSTKAVLHSRGNANHSRRANSHKRNQPSMMLARYQPPVQDYVAVRQEVFFVVTQRTAAGEEQSWQVHMWQVSLQPQSKIVQKPRKI